MMVGEGGSPIDNLFHGLYLIKKTGGVGWLGSKIASFEMT